MTRMPLVLGMIVTLVAASVAAKAQTPAGDERSQVRFEVRQTQSHRGLAVEGWAYNDLPWQIANVRLRVDCLDASGTVTRSAPGWVYGDISAGGRAYFYVSIPSPASTYRVSVESFDKVAPLQAP